MNSIESKPNLNNTRNQHLKIKENNSVSPNNRKLENNNMSFSPQVSSNDQNKNNEISFDAK